MFDFQDSFLTRLLSHDEQAFAEFYEMTVDVFYRYLVGRYFLSKQDAEDLLSDFYLKCRNGIDAYNPEYQFETYVRSILKNHTKDFFKKKKSIQLSDEHMNDQSLVEGDEGSLLEDLQKGYDLESIQFAMQELDEQSYLIIFKRYIEELSYEELSEELGLSQDALRQRLSRALKKIRDILG